MRLNPDAAAGVLKALIQEDRTEARLYRDRIQKVSYGLVVASFAISGFLLGNASHMTVVQLRYLTLSVDLGLVALMVMFYCLIRPDFVQLRKAQKMRQDQLNRLPEKESVEFDPFEDPEKVKPPIKDFVKDGDLIWVVFLSAAVVLAKTLTLFIA